MKTPADLLYERVIQTIEPLTRFDANSLARAHDKTTEAEGSASFWYIPKFEVQSQTAAGPLPGAVRTFPSVGAARQAANQAQSAAAAALTERLQLWASRHGGDGNALSVSDCFEGLPDFGAQSRCGSCSGEGKTSCGACAGRGRYPCNGCGGRGQSACSGCSGRGTERCGTCGGMGRQQKYVTKTVWDGYNNRYNSQSQLEWENCSMCMSSGQRTCGRCGGSRNVTCYTCGGQGQIHCGPCSTTGFVKCSTCDATGNVHERSRLQCSVSTRWEIQALHDSSEAVARLQAFSVDQLFALGRVKQAAPEVHGQTVRRRYPFTCTVTRLAVDVGEQVVTFVGYGDQAQVFDFKNIVGLLLEADLQTLEQSVKAAPPISFRPQPQLMDAVARCLQSEANAYLGEGGDKAQRLMAAGTLSSEYASRLTTALRGALRKLYFGEVFLGGAAAAVTPALGVIALYLAGWWPATHLMLVAALPLVGMTMLAGAEALARKRLNDKFGAELGKGKLSTMLRGQGVLKTTRIVVAVSGFLLFIAALQKFG